MFDQALTLLVMHSTGAMLLMAASLTDGLLRSRGKRLAVAPWVVMECWHPVTESVHTLQDAVAEPWFARAA